MLNMFTSPPPSLVQVALKKSYLREAISGLLKGPDQVSALNLQDLSLY